MLYKIIRPIATVAFKFYFKKIYLKNTDSIPLDKPVFIASNHPTAWIEPCILACFLPNSIHFLVRGNLFGKPFYDKLMKGVHLIPIHRQSDGAVNHHQKNLETFRYCYEALADNKTMLIMPEGSTKQIKRLRPLKKGLARICFGAIDNAPDLDIHIIPVGANFTYADRPRNELTIKVGEPIRVLDFYNKNKDLPAKGMRELTSAVKAGMLDTIIHIEDENDDELAEQFFQVLRGETNKSYFPVLNKNNSEDLVAERSVVGRINKLTPVEKENWKEKCRQYFQLSADLNLKEGYLKKGNNVMDFILLAIAGIPALIGFIFHFPIVAIADYNDRNRVKQLEFRQPIWLSIQIVLMPIYYLIWFVAAIITANYWLTAIILLMPLFGYIFLIMRELRLKMKNRKRFDSISEKSKSELLGLRDEVLKFFQKSD